MNNNDVLSRNANKTGKEIFNVKEKSTNVSNIISKNKIAQIVAKKIKVIQDKKIVKKNIKKTSNYPNNGANNIPQKKTFIEMGGANKPSFINNYMNKVKQNDKCPYFYSFIENNSIPIDKYINKGRFLLNNRKNHIKDNCTFTKFEKTAKKHSTTFITYNKKEKENLINKQTKNNKNIIESYNNKNIYQKNNISNYSYYISNLISKKPKIRKKNLNISGKNIKNKTLIKDKIKNNEDIDCIFDIVSEHKQSINLLKEENYNVNKPHEYNMKFSLLKEYEDDGSDNNLNEEKNEKVIIGKIEGYKDIIELDEINNKIKLNKKAGKEEKKSFLKNKINKKTVKTNKFLENSHFFEDDSDDFFELNFANNYCKTNFNLENIENEYEFEDLPTNEIDNNINKNKLKLFNKDKVIFNW